MSILRYPYDIIDKSTDYFKLEVIEYKAGGQFSGDLATGTTGQTSTSLSGAAAKTTIILPIPQSISDNNSAGWGEDRINDIAAYGVGKIVKAMSSESPEAALAEVGNIMNEVRDTSSGARGSAFINYLKNMAVAGAANQLGANVSAQGLLARSSGQIINQNLELLFQSVALRSFNFSFGFTPRDKTEAEQVKEIIRTLKIASAPKKDPQLLGFLNSPDVFRISYMKGGSFHPYLNQFKICALKNMSVNYTASGTYATYDDGFPIHSQLSLSFTELNPVYQDEQESSSGMGY